VVHLTASQQEILRLLRRSGEMAVDEIAQAMGISRVAVRKHLDALVADGLLAARPRRRQIGRPHHVYRLTDAADELFPKAYAGLATGILEFLETTDGPAKLDAVFADRRARVEAHLRPLLAGKDLATRVRLLAEAQDRAGYMAEWRETEPGTFVLSENNCAICCIARRFPQACQQELEMFRNLLEADVERTEHLVAGDGRCAYRIRRRHRNGSANGSAPEPPVA